MNSYLVEREKKFHQHLAEAYRVLNTMCNALESVENSEIRVAIEAAVAWLKE